MSTYTCDGCSDEFDGERVVFTTEATDEHGLDVTVAKRWTTCPDCADDLFATIGRKAPWDDGDATVMAMPDDADQVAAPLGGDQRADRRLTTGAGRLSARTRRWEPDIVRLGPHAQGAC